MRIISIMPINYQGQNQKTKHKFNYENKNMKSDVNFRGFGLFKKTEPALEESLNMVKDLYAPKIIELKNKINEVISKLEPEKAKAKIIDAQARLKLEGPIGRDKSHSPEGARRKIYDSNKIAKDRINERRFKRVNKATNYDFTESQNEQYGVLVKLYKELRTLKDDLKGTIDHMNIQLRGTKINYYKNKKYAKLEEKLKKIEDRKGA